MKSITFYGIIIFLFSLINAQERFQPGVILFKLNNPENVTIRKNEVVNGSARINEVFKKTQPINVHKFHAAGTNMKGWYQIEWPLNANITDIKRELENCPDINTITFNYYGVLASTPQDPLWADQWALQKIRVSEAWDICKANSEILVGIMDTGLDYTHEDIIDNTWQNLGEDYDGDGHTLEWNGSDFVLDPGDINGIDDDDFDNDPSTYIDDLIGWNFNYNTNDPQEINHMHGTKVAGVISAKTYNNKGLSGVAGGWQNQNGVKLIGLTISEPIFGHWLQALAVNAITYLTDIRNQGHTVIVNMSIATTGIEDEPMLIFEDAIADAKLAGVIMVSAAGNVRGKGPYSSPEVFELPIPARYEGVIAVGASTNGYTLYDETRWFDSLYDIEDDEKLHIVTPVSDPIITGYNVTTTEPFNVYTNNFTATSAACPIAVGTIALMLSANPDLTYSEIEDILAATAEKIGPYQYYGSPSRTAEVGYGRLNAFKAVLEAEHGTWYHAYRNKSYVSSATYANGARHLVQGGGYLHEVFTTTDGMIFYRRSDDNGQNWQITKRITGELNDNRSACILYKDGKIHAVWQRALGSYQYEVYYANTDAQSIAWSDPFLLSAVTTTSLQAGAMPVISYTDSPDKLVAV